MTILTSGGNFKIGEIRIGEKRVDQSYAQVEVSAPTGEALDELILRLRQHGAEALEKKEAQIAAAPADGIFPADFYVTTNQQTFVRLGNKEIEVQPVMMDSGMAVDREKRTARSVKFHEVRKGDADRGWPSGHARSPAAALHFAHGCLSIPEQRQSRWSDQRAPSFASSLRVPPSPPRGRKDPRRGADRPLFTPAPQNIWRS